MEHPTHRRRFSLSVLLVREETRWVAQCLEFDLAAQGDTLREAKQAFVGTFISQVLADISAMREPLSTFKPAPETVFEKFANAWRADAREPIPLPPPHMIEASLTDLRVYG